MTSTPTQPVAAAQNAKDFGKTVHLPKTSFPMRANLPQREPGWVQRWLDEQVYEKLLTQRRATGAPTYIVHLGPPYANGNFHMGHLLTYVLKDFVVRHKFMAGFASPYVPGWDCHGLPIEWKIETELREKGQTKQSISISELRARCRAYAQKWSEVQMADWQRLGALADWQRPYRTMDKANEAGIVSCLGELVQRGLVYKKLRSTLWAPVEETALAEAEIEYDEQHKSTALYVALELLDRPGEHLVIWTTTPWTLPANKAVAVKEDEGYTLLDTFAVGRSDVEISENLGKRYWIAEKLKDSFFAELKKASENNSTYLFNSIRSCKGSDLLGLTYRHPIYANQTGKVYHGDHVTTDSGTGMVHIAPAHGAEDFVLGEKVGLDSRCPVNGSGRYEEWVDDGLPVGLTLKGRSVLDKQVTADILSALSDKLLHSSTYVHKYPISWRSKAPVIFRTTEQWFIDLDKSIPQLGGQSVRERSLNLIHGQEKAGGGRNALGGGDFCDSRSASTTAYGVVCEERSAREAQKAPRPVALRKVNWVPEYGENRIGSMIAGRPDWCISRQRAWGVPITIMVDKQTGEPLADKAVWEHIAALVAAEGIDAWDTRLAGREAELFPPGWLQQHGKTATDYTYVRDILDVWFDSGTTWSHVVKADSAPGQRFERNDGKRPADLYQEGSDQHRGWFHSSLLTSVALTGDAPYESVVTSGFVVDGQGRKFSKSLGNGVAPKDLLDKYGMDILRLWVASADYSEDIRYSPQILESSAEAYRGLRNTLRWLLGNLPEGGGAVPSVAPDAMPELEQYILHRLSVVMADVHAHFEAFQFHYGLRVLQTFCTTELSNFYFDVRKDCLYCDRADSSTRMACVQALEHIFRALTTRLAPLLPFTADEAWRCRYGESACVHLERYEDKGLGIRDKGDATWPALLALRDEANRAIETLRAAGTIGANAEVELTYSGAFSAALVQLVCGVSAAHKGVELKVAKHPGHKCPRCWRYYETLTTQGLCQRCEEAVRE